MKVVPVALGSRSYKIQVGKNLLKSTGALAKELGLGKRCAVITDSTVGPIHAETVLKSLERAGFETVCFQIKAGEVSKALPIVASAYDELATHRLERKSFVVALGGGVVGDLAGFVAATYLRGIPFIQIPTTLLSQVDSSVGGKVGVNLPAGKNLVGAFYQPKAVLCDLNSLSTLEQREYRSGLAEVIKYGIIYDAPLFAKLERDLPKLLKLQPAALEETVARCCEIKADVVGQDETETGLRAILNFGHTIGHAIENISGYGKYLHGEAISIGQVAAARLSEKLTGLGREESARIEQLFARAGLPTTIKLNKTQRTRLFAAMQLDKKVSAGEIKFVLAKRIGEVQWGCKVPAEFIHEVLDSLEG